MPDLEAIRPLPGVDFSNDEPLSILPAMGAGQAILDALRDGPVKAERALIPDCPEARAKHLRGFAHFCDAPQVGFCRIPAAGWRQNRLENPRVAALADQVNGQDINTFAAGIDAVIASLRKILSKPLQSCADHSHALVLLYDYPRDPVRGEPGADWIHDAQAQRACLRGAETAVTLANYLRLLGYPARAHSMAASDVHLERLAVAAGLTRAEDGAAVSPFHGHRFGLAAVTTSMEIAPDRPLKSDSRPPLSWHTGLGRHARNRHNADPYARRRFRDGPLPFERLKRVDTPTTHIDAANVARVPKRASMFARALFGDLGTKAQESSKNGDYIRKSAAAFAFRPTLGALLLLRGGTGDGTGGGQAGDAAQSAIQRPNRPPGQPPGQHPGQHPGRQPGQPPDPPARREPWGEATEAARMARRMTARMTARMTGKPPRRADVAMRPSAETAQTASKATGPAEASPEEPPEAAGKTTGAADEAARNAANIKGAAYFLGADAVGISACPDYAYYSHDAAGEPITPYHGEAISIIVDQGFETMEGASGDDWIACAQSMRAYLRFALIGGVIGEHLRRLGHPARVHSVVDDEVLNPPLLLLSGLGEVSRIGDVVLNPFLGPRLKSGVVTTNMPLAHDKPIDFGLQRFCAACSKCARECPSGAITAGPKRMFNAYEVWKPDSQKCLTYRVTQQGGAMCGRCMKTCPWNLEGLFAEAPFRWLASHLPGAARPLARLDDWLGRGAINPRKTWWWDLEMVGEGPYAPARKPANRRALSRGLKLRPEQQTLAAYPANLAPPPHPWPFPADREAGIAAYKALISARTYRARRARGLPPEHVYTADRAPSPVLALTVSRIVRMTEDVTCYDLALPDGGPLPAFSAGAHIDVLVAPEFLRSYSLCGDPAERHRYRIAVKREDRGRGGSKLLHRIFAEGRRVFVSHPVNHFPLVEAARRSLLFGGGIGVSPLIAMGHRLHALGRDFTLHFSAPSRAQAPFLAELAGFAWADRVRLHLSDEGSRADLARLLSYRPGTYLHICGPAAYMEAVSEAARAAGFPEEALHRELFAPPEEPEHVSHPFTLKLARSGREVAVAADQSAAEALQGAGLPVHVKCADGLCGSCQCGLLSGAVEHRDHVLSDAERESRMILCRSRAQEPGGVVEIDL